MAISFDRALGIHQHTVGVRERNSEVIATNIAQANTPGFKAKEWTSRRHCKRQVRGQALVLAVPIVGIFLPLQR